MIKRTNIITKARKANCQLPVVTETEWLYNFLYKFSHKFPQMFDLFLNELDLNDKQKRIIKYRYQENKGWKEIPSMQGVNVELRQVMHLHRDAIDTILYM